MDAAEQRLMIDSLCERLQSAWRNGSHLSIEELFFSQADGQPPVELEQVDTLVGLIQFEMELRRSHGQSPEMEDYASRFPQVSRDILEELIRFPAIPLPRQTQSRLPVRYQQIEKIGQGGIGQVWRVRDLHMNRVMVVKMALDRYRTDSSVNLRIKREATLTGSLQHPGIPPIFDHGLLSDGSEYFSMKLVDGETLGEILGNRVDPDRDFTFLIGIFEQIVQTIAYAHSQQVIHRDLKPHNVMVGAFGEVQVMDWGMGKQLNVAPQRSSPTVPPVAGVSNQMDTSAASRDSSIVDPLHGMTKTGDVIGTPAYMAPEQARGETESLGPPCDVFGLGVILFEILTNRQLYDEIPSAKILETVAEGRLDPSIAHLDRIDVDRELVELCKDCLSPHKDDRPNDAGQVSKRITEYQLGVQQRLKQADIERHAAEVKAVEERKRRRVAFWLCGGIAGAISLGLIGVIWQLNQAIDARSLADKRFLQAKKTVDEYLVEVSESQSLLDSSPDTQKLRRKLLEKAKSYYLSFVATKPDDPELMDELAGAYFSLGTIAQELNSGEEPLAFYEECITICDQLIQDGTEQPATILRRLDATNRSAQVYDRVGKLQESIRCSEKAIEIGDREASADPQIVAKQGEAYRMLALTYKRMGQDADAEQYIDTAMRINAALVEQHPDNDYFQRYYATTLFRNGKLKFRWNKSQESIDSYNEAIEIYSRLNSTNPDADTTYKLSLCRTGVAETYWQIGKSKLAIDALRQSVDEISRISTRNPAVFDYKDDWALTLSLLGSYLFDSDEERQSGVEAIQKALELLDQTLEIHPESISLLSRYAHTSANLAQCFITMRKNEDALNAREKSLLFHQRIRQLTPDDRDPVVDVIRDYQTIGMLRRRTGKIESAGDAYQTAISMISELESAGEGDADLTMVKAGIYNNLAYLYLAEGQLEQAVEPFALAIRTYAMLANGDASLKAYYWQGSSTANLGSVLAKLSKLDESLEKYNQAVDILEKAAAKRSKEFGVKEYLFEALLGRADVLLELEQFEASAADLNRALEVYPGPYRLIAKIKLLGVEARQGIDLDKKSAAIDEICENLDPRFPQSDALVESAKVLTQAATSIAADQSLSESEQTRQADEFIASAAKLLIQSIEVGKFMVLTPKRLETELSLQGYWDHPGFREVVERIETEKSDK